MRKKLILLAFIIPFALWAPNGYTYENYSDCIICHHKAENCSSCHSWDTSLPGIAEYHDNNDFDQCLSCHSATNEPDINLSSNSLNFSQVELGNTQNRFAELKNIGTEMLNITGIKLCAGTSTEYTWSPSEPLTLGPGAGQTLTVFYDPVDQNSDEGCLIITSNDPDENSVFLNLTGSGFAPQPIVLDVDIARFQVGKRVSLGRGRGIRIKLVVNNKNTTTESLTGTIIGKQGETEVYREVISEEVKSGRNTIMRTYTPKEIGNIVWSIKIDDEDTDIDEATATTRVVR